MIAGASCEVALSDGAVLRGRDWPAPAPQARMLLVHGLGEHAGRYAALARELNALGVSVRAFDLCGHGLSPGRRGVWPAADRPPSQDA